MTVHRMYFFCNNDMGWNIFDTVLVSFALFDQVFTAVMSNNGSGGNELMFMRTLRVLKLARVLRGLRVIKVFDELRLMVRSMLGSFMALFWSISMMILNFYIFSLVFVQGVANYIMSEGDRTDIMTSESLQTLVKNFGSVEESILTLYKASSGGEDWDAYHSIIEQIGWTYSALYVFFIAFTQISLLNVILAIFVQRAIKLATPDREAQALELRAEEMADFQEIHEIMSSSDLNKSGTISMEEFTEVISKGKMGALLAAMGLHIKDAGSFFKLVSSDGNKDTEAQLGELVQRCMALRGTASCIEVEQLKLDIHTITKSNRAFRHECMDLLESIMEAVENLQPHRVL